MNEKVLNEEVYAIEIANILNDTNLQTKIIKLILDEDDSKFRDEIWDIIKLDFFESSLHKFVLKYLIQYVNKYNRIPPEDTLQLLLSKYVKDEDEKEKVREFVRYIFSYEVKDKDFVIETTLDFFRKQALKKTLFKAAEQFDVGNFNEIANTINNALKKFEPKSRGHNYLRDIKKRMAEKVRNPITCLPGLDKSIGGGLAAGELGIILSPTGGGKSMLLVRFGAEAFRAGYKVLYFTLELSDEAIGVRFDACLNNFPMNFVRQYEEQITATANKIAAKGGELIIEPYLETKPTVNTLKNKILTLKRESGFVPDVIIVDYADLMKPAVHYSDKRHGLTDIYESLINLGNEMKCPVWTASQVNRGGYENEGFSVANIAEDIGKANTADLIVGVVRTKPNKLAKNAKLQIMKNRNGADGYDLDMLFDTSTVQIEINSVDATGVVNLSGFQMEEQINQ